MDPVFGLPAIKDSKALDGARQRNRIQQKILSNRISDLDTQYQNRTLKILNDKKSTREFLAEIKPQLSSQNRDECNMEKLTKPMTLLELDHKLTELRSERLQDKMGKTQGILRRTRVERICCRRVIANKFRVTPGASIVPWHSNSGVTFSKCKHVINQMQKFDSKALNDGASDLKIRGFRKKTHKKIDTKNWNHRDNSAIPLGVNKPRRHTILGHNSAPVGMVKLGSISRVKRPSVEELFAKWKNEGFSKVQYKI